ncbi:MAG: class I SAM-dependent methyltransferase [Chloroflexi bacterium]|nr:class I SAM-dependent methyltransferase [Chloroflexota bacterium]
MEIRAVRTGLSGMVAETRDIWNRKAAHWDEYMGEGNDWHRKLISPAVERLLALRPGETVLDVACGNGMLARRLARQGARVVACDFSEAFIERARARSTAFSDRIEYAVVDATDRDQLLQLGERRFDAATCTQGLMDMPAIAPLYEAMTRLVKPGGRFVITVPHPCFNTHGMSMLAEALEDEEGRRTVSSIKLTRYLTPQTVKGAGVPGEPEPHYYFDRALRDLLGPAFRAGLVLDGLEEPSFEPDPEGATPLSWPSLPEFPPVLAAKFRVIGCFGS